MLYASVDRTAFDSKEPVPRDIRPRMRARGVMRRSEIYAGQFLNYEWYLTVINVQPKKVCVDMMKTNTLS
jgi:hypothetical protein